MSNMSVYRQLVSSNVTFFGALSNEIGLKTTCVPFANKAVEALGSLGTLSQAEATKAANTFLDNLQTLHQGGITPEDHDKIDFVKRGKVVTVSARVEAFLRAAARKGYRITDEIIAVPAADADTTFFEEVFYNGDFVYVLKDRRFNPDREITADRIIKGYFSKFICRLDVTELSGKRLLMTVCEMSNNELLEISRTSEQGFFKTRWEKYVDDYGKERKRKVVTSDINPDSFWTKWTGEMVKKTIIRRALKRVKEVLPELKETIYAFDREPAEEVPELPERMIDIPPIEEPEETAGVDLNKLTAEQKADVGEMLELFKANPKLAKDKTAEIKAALTGGKPLQEVINAEYAAIMNIKRSKSLWPEIADYFKEEPKNEKG